MPDPKPVAVLRVFDIQEEDGTTRRYDAHAIAGALELEPGDYELVVRDRTPGVSGADGQTFRASDADGGKTTP